MRRQWGELSRQVGRVPKRLSVVPSLGHELPGPPARPPALYVLNSGVSVALSPGGTPPQGPRKPQMGGRHAPRRHQVTCPHVMTRHQPVPRPGAMCPQLWAVVSVQMKCARLHFSRVSCPAELPGAPAAGHLAHKGRTQTSSQASRGEASIFRPCTPKFKIPNEQPCKGGRGDSSPLGLCCWAVGWR